MGLSVFAVFLLGCTAQQALPAPQPAPEPRQYICDDGVTIVTDLVNCPKIDKELKECEEASSKSDYYGESDRDICFFDLALSRENVSLCRRIMPSDSYYSEYTAAKCGAELALLKDNPNLCDELTISSKYECYSILAEELEDYTLCEYITSKSKKDDCLYDYLSYNLYYIDDWDICEMFSETSWERSYCYTEAASQTGSIKYCDNVEDGYGGYYSYSKADCYAEVALAENKASICEGLSDSDDRDDCYYYYATTYPYDVDTCKKIKDSNYKDDCIDWANYSYYW